MQYVGILWHKYSCTADFFGWFYITLGVTVGMRGGVSVAKFELFLRHTLFNRVGSKLSR